MTTLQIPTLFDRTPFYSQRTTLDGTDYNLEFAWSVRESRWYLTLRDSLGGLLVGSQKILADWPMLQYYHHRAGMPTGELMAVCVQPNKAPPGLEELGIGQRCVLCYLPSGG
jgi:hypothetical protein